MKDNVLFNCIINEFSDCDSYVLDITKYKKFEHYNNIAWTELLNNRNDVLKEIDKWYQIDGVFNRYLPAIIVHIMNNGFHDDEYVFYLMIKFKKDKYSVRSDYFYQLHIFTNQQKKIMADFLFILNKKCPCYKDIIDNILFELNLSMDIFDLLQLVYQTKVLNEVLQEQEIVDFKYLGDVGLPHLLGGLKCEMLLTLPYNDQEKLFNNYILLSDKAFVCFFPAFISACLFDLQGAIDTTIGNAAPLEKMLFYLENIYRDNQITAFGKKMKLVKNNKELKFIMIDFIRLIEKVSDCSLENLLKFWHD